MKILSFAADDDTIKELNNFQLKGYKGRSEVIRSAIKVLKDQEDEKNKLQGVLDAVLLIKHNEKNSNLIASILHKYQPLIKTHIHTHLENHKCLELLMLKGEGSKIKQTLSSLETSKKTEFVKLIVS